jgi:hypothetical protein
MRFFFPFASSILLGFTLACGGAIADSGGTPPEGAGPSDPGDQPEDEAVREVASRLVVDGLSCTITREEFESNPGSPSWSQIVWAECGGDIGWFALHLRSKHGIAYPQVCGGEVRLDVTIGAEGDAGFDTYVANSDRGACSVTGGGAAANVTFTARAESPEGAVHVIQYRAR